MSSDSSKYVEAASTLAVVDASTSPLLFLSADLTVIRASASFCRAFEIDPATASGRKLSDLGEGEWNLPRLRSLLSATASGSAAIVAYEMDLVRSNRPVHNLVLNAHKLDDGDGEHIRLLLAIVDVTDLRASDKLKDDLIREKAILLQEVQHRVANSLQIIASVLMQSARKVQSEEARGHLHDAHHRVMSIAAVQRQLAISSALEVRLRPYLMELCESLGASMIYDHGRLSIEADIDKSIVSADASVSLGLIVTELVINSLKHAFAGHTGKIVVGYHSEGANWTLSVSDNGAGMLSGPRFAKPGLGTGIVEALARQLGAKIKVSPANPGTNVTLTHTPLTVPDVAEMAL